MAKGVRFYEVGGPAVLRYETIEIPPLQVHEARIRQVAVGLNFIDTYQRSGLYKVPLPSLLGSEGAGVVEEVGNAVTNLKSGDRVAYAGGALGAYAEVRNIQADRLCKLPDSISFEHGAAMMLKGLTVQYLIRRTYPVQAGDTEE